MASGPVRAFTVSDSVQLALDHWMDSVLRSSPAKRALFHSAISYPRFLELQAKAALHIAPDSSEALTIPTETLSDSGGAKSVASDAENYQNDPSVVINRRYPNIVAIGANDHRMSNLGMPCYFSVDTGHSWKTVFIPTEFGTQALGDPVLAYHLDGTLFYGYMRAEVGLQHDNVLVAISTDGSHWRNATPVIPADQLSGYEDKEFICVDRSLYSSHVGRVYAVWTHYDTSGVTGSVMIAWSDDTCKTWSLPKSISPDLGHFCEIKTGKFGEVIVGYSVEKDSLSGTHWLAVSSNGGQTFAKRFISNYTIYPANVNGYPALKGLNGFRCYPYLSFDVNLFTDQIHVVYGDWFVGGKVAMLYYVGSSNLGVNWSFPYAVGYDGHSPTDTTIRDRFCPWVSVSQLTGEAYATYYSSETDPSNVRTAAYRVELDHNGFSHPHRLSIAEFNPLEVRNAPGKQPFIGDYITSDAYEPVFASAWTEGNPDSHIGNIMGFVGVNQQQNAVPSGNAVAAETVIRSVTPNPSLDHRIRITMRSASATYGTIELMDIEGKIVATLWQGRLSSDSELSAECAIPDVAAGAYLLRLTTDLGSESRRISIY